MPITGSTLAPTVARLGVMRLGATRLNYYQPLLRMTLNGVVRKIHQETGLSIQDYKDGTPNTGAFRVRGFVPVQGQEVKIGLGDLGAPRLIFAGHILSVTEVYVGSPSNLLYDVNCISYEWLLNRRTVTGRFTATSATDIVLWIMGFTSGFSTAGVETNLPALDEITFTNETVTSALERVKDRLGASWVLDYSKVLHFGLDIQPSTSAIHDITTADPHSMDGVAKHVDLSQVRTRVLVEGGGGVTKVDLAAGDTVIPVDDASWYDSAAGGTVVVGPQRVNYAGVAVGGAGALVGTTVTPTNGPTAVRAVGAGVDTGDHQYKQTFVTASGETLPSPVSATVSNGAAVTPPSAAPAVTEVFGGNLGAGVYQWAVTFVDATGAETLAGPIVSATVGASDYAAPSAAPVAAMPFGGAAALNGTWLFKYTFVNGSHETLPSAASNSLVNATSRALAVVRAGLSVPPSGFDTQFYRSKDGGPYLKMGGASDGFELDNATYLYNDTNDTGAGGAAIPAVSTAVFRQVSLSAIPVSSDPGITKRNIYRTAVGGTQLKLVATINDNTTTTYSDNLADGSLGANVPTSSTALYNRAALSSIAVGPTGTTARKLYRNTVAAPSTFKLLATLADNTTTTYTDSTADASLGATAPIADTSGLVTQTGEVAAGSTSIPVTSTSPFSATGGWAYIGALPFKYTGYSASALTGVPASGVGALTTTVRYAVEIIAASMLTGVPASGTGAVLYSVQTGEAVNLLVTRDDTAAQTALAALLGSGDGIVEDYIQDNRLSQTEAENRGDARLEEVKDPLVTVSYRTFDLTTRSGLDVTFNLDAPSTVAGTYKVQSVTFGEFEHGKTRPRRTVQASSRRFTLEALLRLIKAA
jgi:hypothetical protein